MCFDNKCETLVNNQINLNIESPLINQIIETHRSYNYEIVYQCLTQIAIGLNED